MNLATFVTAILYAPGTISTSSNPVQDRRQNNVLCNLGCRKRLPPQGLCQSVLFSRPEAIAFRHSTLVLKDRTTILGAYMPYRSLHASNAEENLFDVTRMLISSSVSHFTAQYLDFIKWKSSLLSIEKNLLLALEDCIRIRRSISDFRFLLSVPRHGVFVPLFLRLVLFRRVQREILHLEEVH